mmetsp:Transcript_65561/g.182253  ORF Transcript_65561/g.182253 Transcript_65561/m.182253 type:complete len:386 (-) Transcript_65561:678-1835(-)
MQQLLQRVLLLVEHTEVENKTLQDPVWKDLHAQQTSEIRDHDRHEVRTPDRAVDTVVLAFGDCGLQWYAPGIECRMTTGAFCTARGSTAVSRFIHLGRRCTICRLVGPRRLSPCDLISRCAEEVGIEDLGDHVLLGQDGLLPYQGFELLQGHRAVACLTVAVRPGRQRLDRYPICMVHHAEALRELCETHLRLERSLQQLHDMFPAIHAPQEQLNHCGKVVRNLRGKVPQHRLHVDLEPKHHAAAAVDNRRSADVFPTCTRIRILVLPANGHVYRRGAADVRHKGFLPVSYIIHDRHGLLHTVHDQQVVDLRQPQHAYTRRLAVHEVYNDVVLGRPLERIGDVAERHTTVQAVGVDAICGIVDGHHNHVVCLYGLAPPEHEVELG